MKAMAKQPCRRYASAADLAADLTRHLQGEPVLARPVGRLGTVWRRCRRRPLLSGLVASLVLAVVAGMAGVTWQWQRAEYQRRRAVEALQHGSRALAALLPLFDSGVDGQDRPGREREVLRTVVLEYYRSSVQHQLRTDPELRDPLSSITMGVIGLLHRTAPSDEALLAFQEARSSFVGLLRDDPTNPAVQDCAARCLTCEGVLLAEAGRLEEGEARLSEGCNQWQAYVTLKKREPAADLSYRSARGLDREPERTRFGRSPSRPQGRSARVPSPSARARRRPPPRAAGQRVGAATPGAGLLGGRRAGARRSPRRGDFPVAVRQRPR